MNNQDLDSIINLILEARTNSGISPKTTTAALNGMNALRSKYKSLPSIPSEVVNMLIDMQASLLTSGERHKSDLANAPMANKIFEVALRLAEMARDMTSPKTET